MCKASPPHLTSDPVQVWASVSAPNLQVREGVVEGQRNGWGFQGSPVTPLWEQTHFLDNSTPGYKGRTLITCNVLYFCQASTRLGTMTVEDR